MIAGPGNELSGESEGFETRKSELPTDVKHYAGILVVTSPAQFDSTVADLNELDGVEVHHTDREQGRIIAVQESAKLREQEAGLRRIQRLPHVKLAELVVHRIDDSGAPGDPEARRT